MEMRIEYAQVSPGAVKALLELEKFVQSTAIDKDLIELIKLRVSQINGCAYCIDVHWTDARKKGESERKLNAVSVWQESPFFTEVERVALGWAEAITLISENHASDEAYQAVRQHFEEKDTVDLTMAIISINCWNRLAISFRKQPKPLD